MTVLGSHHLFVEDTDMSEEAAVCLDTVLTLSNGADRSCVCLSGSVVSAFVAMAQVGHLPHPGQEWLLRVEGHVSVNAQAEQPPLYAFSGLCRDLPHDPLFDGRAFQAVFESGENSAFIGRWTIAATLLLLIDVGHLPVISAEWRAQLKRVFEGSSAAVEGLAEGPLRGSRDV